MRKLYPALLLSAAAFALPEVASAGGGWVTPQGEWDLQLGYSRKTASTSWDVNGNSFQNTTTVDGKLDKHYHDFRYTYLSGEVGLFDRVSGTFLVTHLHGLEGRHEDLERNTGLSDAWFGVKVALARGEWPVAAALTVRTPYFYDLPGAYNRYLFDAQGNRRGVSPEWRGLLKEDWTASVLVSHSLAHGGWVNFEAGHTWREGAPANAIPVNVDFGHPLPWKKLTVKGGLNYVHSLGNDSLAEPDDRFRARATFNFNDASSLRAGVGVLIPLPEGWPTLEVGYNRMVWGESVRRYDEPYLSFAYRF